MVAPSRSFLCVRHGITDWNKQGRLQGLTDIPLNDEGVAQARLAERRLRDVPIDILVSSPLVRATTTAGIIASGRSVEIDADLIECNFGSLEGRPISDVMAETGISSVEDLTTILPPDAEPWPSVSKRALRCVGKWLDLHPRSAILFVSHDAVMQAMCNKLSGRWFNNRHATPFTFGRTGDSWTVEELA